MTPNQDDRLLPAAQVRARYGGVSHMWIERRLKGDPKFPRPLYIAKRRFWRVQELVKWEQDKAAGQTP